MQTRIRSPRTRAASGVALLCALGLVALPAEGCSDGEGPAPKGDPAAGAPQPESQESRPPGGRWRRVEGAGLTDEQRAEIEKLREIGYASGSSGGSGASGVSVHRQDMVAPGLNFYTSGHGPGAALMDMDGKVLHTWKKSVKEVWPYEELSGRNLAITQFWRRAHLYENGDVVAIFEGHSIFRLDRNSKVLWKSRCGAHHDLEVLENGDVIVLTRKAHVIPGFDPDHPVLEDFVSVLGAHGWGSSDFSILEALDSSPFDELMESARARRGDILHTNSLTILDGRLAERIPAFAKGNLLISSRAMSFLAVLDPRAKEVVWTLSGDFKDQHDPKILANGNLLLFDNNGAGEASAVLELDPANGDVLWEYRGGPETPFWSRTCGTAERLPNGNTLITESDAGRAFEVTAKGEIVWEFWNPARAGADNEYIATLFDVVRLGQDFPLDWLE